MTNSVYTTFTHLAPSALSSPTMVRCLVNRAARVTLKLRLLELVGRVISRLIIGTRSRPRPEGVRRHSGALDCGPVLFSPLPVIWLGRR